jgi:outer membrane protein OmpA-like peptidoglycan-associated protein
MPIGSALYHHVKTVVFFLLLPTWVASVQAQDLSGHWVGKLGVFNKPSAYPLLLDIQQTGTELHGHLTRKTATGAWVVMQVKGTTIQDRVSLIEEHIVGQSNPTQQWRLGELTGKPHLVVDTLVMRGTWNGNTTYPKGASIDTVAGYGGFIMRRVSNRPRLTLATTATAPPRPAETQTLKKVLFARGKADLVAIARPELDELSRRLQEALTTTVQVAGYTDQVGESAKNQVLSQQRAEVVKRYLVSKGIAARRITATGYGDTNLVCPTPCTANQRVEVTLSTK